MFTNYFPLLHSVEKIILKNVVHNSQRAINHRISKIKPSTWLQTDSNRVSSYLSKSGNSGRTSRGCKFLLVECTGRVLHASNED